MKILLRIFFLAALMLGAAIPAIASGTVSDYTPVFKPFRLPGNGIEIAVREFKRGGKTEFLVVNAATFDTRITDDLSAAKLDDAALADTLFMKALARYNGHQAGFQNHGLKESESGKGLVLTVDLCPSGKPLDRGLFTTTEAAFGPGSPIAIAVSGEWIAKHMDDFDWLIAEINANRISVTWINHTLTHPYDKDKAIEKNFLLADGVDFEKEALGNEVLLIENGITPTPFFRFPGLVSDNSLLEKLRKLTLIPIGSSAWLAKGEAPKPGSVILVHGNGNEPVGIKRLFEFYGREKKGIENKGVRLMPLKNAF